MLVWAVHYLPFFLMSRQLFIHHYLPSHVASALVAGAVLSFIMSDRINYPISVRGPLTPPKPFQWADLGMKGPVFVGIFGIAMFIMYTYMAALTYGTPGYVHIIVSGTKLYLMVLLQTDRRDGEQQETAEFMDLTFCCQAIWRGSLGFDFANGFVLYKPQCYSNKYSAMKFR